MTTSRTYVPDTHAVVWDFLHHENLSQRARDIFRQAERGEITLVIPTIVLAEIQWISERRIRNVSTEKIPLEWIEKIPSLVVAPFDIEVFQEMRLQPRELELHDRIIAATAKSHGAILVSRDRMLASLLETVW